MDALVVARQRRERGRPHREPRAVSPRRTSAASRSRRSTACAAPSPSSSHVPLAAAGWTLLDHTLRESRRLGLGVDMATGTGWPFGGPWVGAGDAARYVAHGDLHGARRRAAHATPSRSRRRRSCARVTAAPPLDEPARSDRDHAEPAVARASTRCASRSRLPLQALVAYSSAGAVGRPHGARAPPTARSTGPRRPATWTLYALFQGWHGKQVERAAPGRRGGRHRPLLDRRRSRATSRASTRRSRRASRRGAARVLQRLVRGGRRERPGRLDAAPARRVPRAPRLRPARHLPALFERRHAPTRRARPAADYRETVSDLLLDGFTRRWARWAHRRGAVVRNQAHGSPANILDLYAASDIPETEGTELLRHQVRDVGGARHRQAPRVRGGRDVARRALPLDARRRARHGRPVPPGRREPRRLPRHRVLPAPSAPWPGWLFYAAVRVQPAEPVVDGLRRAQRLRRARAVVPAGGRARRTTCCSTSRSTTVAGAAAHARAPGAARRTSEPGGWAPPRAPRALDASTPRYDLRVPRRGRHDAGARLRVRLRLRPPAR